MSFGKKSPLYLPATKSMLPFMGEHFTHIPTDVAENVHSILTDGLHIETLLLVSVLDMIDRHASGERDKASFGFGAGIKLSAISLDKSHKAQSEEMEIVHDVMVELPMAGSNYLKLQDYLNERLGYTVVMYHSCGDAVIDFADREAFYAACKEEQFLRTGLDWSAETKKHVSIETLTRDYTYTPEESARLANCFSIAKRLVQVATQVAQAPRKNSLAVLV